MKQTSNSTVIRHSRFQNEQFLTIAVRVKKNI